MLFFIFFNIFSPWSNLIIFQLICGYFVQYLWCFKVWIVNGEWYSDCSIYCIEGWCAGPSRCLNIVDFHGFFDHMVFTVGIILSRKFIRPTQCSLQIWTFAHNFLIRIITVFFYTSRSKDISALYVKQAALSPSIFIIHFMHVSLSLKVLTVPAVYQFFTR